MSVSFSTAGLCLLMQPVEHGASSQLYFSRTGMKDIWSFAITDLLLRQRQRLHEIHILVELTEQTGRWEGKNYWRVVMILSQTGRHDDPFSHQGNLGRVFTPTSSSRTEGTSLLRLLQKRGEAKCINLWILNAS